jgi:DNA-binding transcriptional regulator YdaS (Cro superfamily)
MQKMKCNTVAIKEAAKIAGSLKDLAIKTGASYQSVLNWGSGKNNPNPLHCIKIEQVTHGKITRKDILPDYPWDSVVMELKEEKD